MLSCGVQDLFGTLGLPRKGMGIGVVWKKWRVPSTPQKKTQIGEPALPSPGFGARMSVHVRKVRDQLLHFQNYVRIW